MLTTQIPQREIGVKLSQDCRCPPPKNKTKLLFASIFFKQYTYLEPRPLHRVEGWGDGAAHGSFISNVGTNQGFLIPLSSQMVNKLHLAVSWLVLTFLCVLNPDRTLVTKQSNDSTHV